MIWAILTVVWLILSVLFVWINDYADSTGPK